MATFGAFKTNELTLQGKNSSNEPTSGTDFSLEVNMDHLNISRKNPETNNKEVLITFAKDDSVNIDNSVPTMGESDTVVVHKKIMAKQSIMASGMIHAMGELHGMGAKVHAHGNYEVVAGNDEVYQVYAEHDEMLKNMGMNNHMAHMIGMGNIESGISTMFNMGVPLPQTLEVLGPLLALEFCVKMQPHHQEAIDTGDVMYKWAVDGGVGHLGFHLSYWQGYEIDRQHRLGVELIKLINANPQYPQSVKNMVNSYLVKYKRVRAGTGTHYYNNDMNMYMEGGEKDYRKSSEVNYTGSTTGVFEQERDFIKYWPGYNRMMGEQFYQLELGPDDIWPKAEVKFLLEMYYQNDGGHMMISSLLEKLNMLAHPGEVEEYKVTRDTYTKEKFMESLEVLNVVDQQLKDLLNGNEIMSSRYERATMFATIAREYKIYFGEVPYLLKEIERIGLKNRFTWDIAPFTKGSSVGMDHSGMDHGSGGMHNTKNNKICPMTGTAPCNC